MKPTLLFGALMLAAGFSHALSGKVTDLSGKAIPNAKLKVVGSKLKIKTNAEGEFAFDIEAVDELHVEAPGYSHQVIHLHGEYEEPLTIILSRSVIEQMDVIGLPLHVSTMESALPVAVLGGEELRKSQASTLGETLKNEVGVHASYFGPVSSSPIIRGLDGPRVLIAQNGLDVGDASRVGPDHIVATEASTAQQIEILRGPATLFYGSGAIGGVINIVDDRVPRDSQNKGAFSAQQNSVNKENEISAAWTGGNQNYAFHADGFWRNGDDYAIPGIAELESEEEHVEEGHEEHSKGRLENSASRSHGYNFGVSKLLDNGYLGLAYGRLDRLNGVPGHSEHEEENELDPGLHEEEQVLSDLAQDRWQLISELQLNGAFLAGINSKAGFTQYQHAEIEDGNVGTVFKNKSAEVRVDLLHQELDGWRGALSVDAKQIDFEAVGDEAFTSPSKTEQLALAIMEEKHLGEWLWQLGARVEQVSLNADAVEFEAHHEEGTEAEPSLLEFDEFNFTPWSLSAGLVWDFTSGYKFGAAYTHSQRAPSAAELFSVGPHIGTRSYEVGALFEIHQQGDDVHLDYRGTAKKESSNNLDLSLRKHEGDLGFVLNVFYNQVDDFYYQRDTGLSSGELFAHNEEEDAHDHGGDLPVYIFEQADASFYGLEAELAWQIRAPLKWTIWGDSIRGKLDEDGNLPRIPPIRIGNTVNYQIQQWSTELSAVHYFEQDKVASSETHTDAYTMVDAQISYRVDHDRGDLTLFAKVANLTDEEARVHSSFLKTMAPLPGRGFSIGLRTRF